MSEARVDAVVPAAGRARRMGRDKQLLDVGGRPMLEVVLDAMARSQVRRTVLVTHSGIEARLDCGRFRDTHLAINDDPHSHMIDSVRLGLQALPGAGSADAADGVMVVPADQPGINTADMDRCIQTFRADPTRIVIGTFERQRGHPLIFPADLVTFVGSAECDGGLNALPRVHADRVVTVACRSEGVVRDVDTPEDYRQLGK